ncbi:MmgE/PrpD family protein [Sphingomonas sanxanigenens]|uniref:MmgE/PrpD family protein n=1 Tax=Sphingomonas sanxanigenens DSM 19645 = NX02 TaxID=1123269 RepID=W0A7P4_9SPHN|nr:MmgE/PrpD family protein [Sphingomonas sanxanigenens]AHE52358.1 hypothetical protein NX02_03005 [Sphingomonas sanxanigenens DSM 19645 = NX02]
MFCDETISGTLSAHLAAIDTASLPAATLHATRRALLDALGVMLAASGLAEDARPYRRHAEQGAGPARLLGGSGRTSPSLAALANGALAHALDFGDTFDAGPAHPNAALVPALLALADADRGIDGGRFLAAMAGASDLACRLAVAAPCPYEARGWYPPPLVNLIATAAGCAKLLGLGADGIRHAMGLALMQGAFPGEIKYDSTSPLRGVREGFVARAAVEAALLAAGGARAFADPLGGKAGFFAVYAGGAPTAALTDGLGERFLGDLVSFKPWPACRGTHAYIEAALALRPSLDLARITRIEAETGPIQEMLIRPQPAKAQPASAIDARFSIPFTVATAVRDGAVTLDSFTADRLADPGLHRIGASVIERRNPEWGRAEAASGSLTILLDDGSRLFHRVMQAAGHPDWPLSDSALVAKFIGCAGHAAAPVMPAQATAIAAQILDAPLLRAAAAWLD